MKYKFKQPTQIAWDDAWKVNFLKALKLGDGDTIDESFSRAAGLVRLTFEDIKQWCEPIEEPRTEREILKDVKPCGVRKGRIYDPELYDTEGVLKAIRLGEHNQRLIHQPQFSFQSFHEGLDSEDTVFCVQSARMGWIACMDSHGLTGGDDDN